MAIGLDGRSVSHYEARKRRSCSSYGFSFGEICLKARSLIVGQKHESSVLSILFAHGYFKTFFLSESLCFREGLVFFSSH